MIDPRTIVTADIIAELDYAPIVNQDYYIVAIAELEKRAALGDIEAKNYLNSLYF